jgi:hypothetical protein
MKMFTNDVPSIIWARVRNGEIVVWNGREELKFRHAYGRIRGVAYKMDEWNGQAYELCLVHLTHDGERWILSLRTDSQYFRSMCNYLYTAESLGVLGDPLRFAPVITEANGKNYSHLYISHGDKYLRGYFGKNAGQGLPAPLKIDVAGRTVYDFSPITTFYKEFLARHFSPGWGEPTADAMPEAFQVPPPPADDPDDLPF